MNWATLSCGAAVVSVSSEVAGCEAHHVLTDDVSQIWLSDTGIPQWICISLQSIPNYQNVEIRTVGWHCWHSYSTNPREVRIHVSRDGSKFRIWDTVSAALQHQGTQLFCCAPISVALYPYIAFEILTTYGGPQTYMNRIYLYSDEFSPDSVASVSDYERSSLNITMGMGGLKSADTSTLGDDDSRFDDLPPYTRDSRKHVGHRPSLSHNNVSAEILDPTYSGTRVPSTIQHSSPEQLRDDYVAVLQSYDAYSNSLKSLTVDTTVLVDKLSKALGIEGGVGTSIPSSIPSDDNHVLARSVHTADQLLPSMPRDGGLSPRMSRVEPTPPSTENFLRSNNNNNSTNQYTNNPRLWQSDTAAFLSRMHKDNLAAVNNHHHASSMDPMLTTQVDTSATTNHHHPHHHHQQQHNTSSQLLSTSQLPTDNSQRVESLLSSTDGKLYYSARKPNHVVAATAGVADSSTSLASLLNVSQKEVDNLLLVTSLQSQGSSSSSYPSTNVPTTTGAGAGVGGTPARVVENMAVNTSLRLSSEDIGQRLKSLEDKFSTIVTLLEKSDDGENDKQNKDKDNKGETSENRRSRSQRSHHHSHRHSRSRSLSRSPSRSPSPSRRRSRSRSKSHSHHRSDHHGVDHSHRHRHRRHRRTSSRSKSRSRSRSHHRSSSQRQRHHQSHRRPVSSYYYDQGNSSSEEDVHAPVSPSRDRFDMNSLSSSHSQLLARSAGAGAGAGGGGGSSRRRDSNEAKRYLVSGPEDTASTASRESLSTSTSTSRHTMDGTGDGGGSTASTTSTTTSTVLKTVLGRKDGEGVDELVSRILREAKEHGRLSDYTVASLRPPLSSTMMTQQQVSTGPGQDHYTDLLPSAKAAVDISSSMMAAVHSRETSPHHRYTTGGASSSSSSSSSRLLSAAAQSVLDHDAVHRATRRVLDKRYPFPVDSTTAFPSNTQQQHMLEHTLLYPSHDDSKITTNDVQTKLLHLQQQAREIVTRSRSTSPVRPNKRFATTASATTTSAGVMMNHNGGEELTSEIDRLVKDLHHCVLQRTMKEAQLRLLRGEDPTAFL